MTSRIPEAGEATPNDTSPPPVSDSGVSNGSSLCLSESGALSSEQTIEPPSATSAGRDMLSVNSTLVRVEGVKEKSLSCLSLEVCASADNLFMLTQDDLIGTGCASDLGSVERVGLSEDDEEALGLGGEGEGVPRIVLGRHEETMMLHASRDEETCGDAGEGMDTNDQSVALQ